MTRNILLLLLIVLCCNCIFAQKIVGYRTSTHFCPMEISLAQSETLNHIPRFAPFLTVEQRTYYGFGKGTFSIFGSGITHNLGVITQVNDTIFKNRVYSTGALAAVRIGWAKGAVFAGGGVDFPVFYKSKYFVNGVKLGKSRAFFSKEVNWILPHVFVGVDAGFVEVKAQYFLTDFWGKKAPVFVNSPSQIVNISIGFNRIWLENWIKDFTKDSKPDEEDKTKPRRYPWDRNKENET